MVAFCESDAAVPKPRRLYIEDHSVIMSFVKKKLLFFMAIGESLNWTTGKRKEKEKKLSSFCECLCFLVRVNKKLT